MSIKIMSMCWERYPNGGGELLLALALADHADDTGGSIYPSVDTLAKKTRQSKRTIQYQLRAMEDSGWLVCLDRAAGGRSRTRLYCINSLWIKGADFASLVSAEKDAEFAPIDAPETVQDLHPLDAKGCNLEHERVQSTTLKGAIAVAPEPSRTIKNHLLQQTRTGSFPMTLDWKPSDQLSARLLQAGVSADQLTQEVLGEFVSYRSTTDDQLTQAQWEHKLLQTLLARRKVHADQSGKPSGQQRSGRDAVRDAISDTGDTSWAAGL